MKGQSLADLYDVDVMPPSLVLAHRSLDRAIDLCYRPQPFDTELLRMRLLFELYAQRAKEGRLEMDEKKKAKRPRIRREPGNAE